jgi:uncharacterized BrkB/YihY/UPF0761 family membrane protein
MKMLAFVLVFFLASVSVPAIQSLLASGADELPFGLAAVPGLVYVGSLALGLLVLFAILCLIYRTVPNCGVPWRCVWPGALAATLAMGAVDYAFPLYLSGVSTLAKLGPSLVFTLIALLWFYALAIILLGGAVVNELRFGVHETSSAPIVPAPPPRPTPSSAATSSPDG